MAGPDLAREMSAAGNTVLSNLASQFTTLNNETSGIASDAKRQTMMFDDNAIATDLLKGSFDFREMKKSPCTVMLILPPLEMKRQAAYLRMVVDTALRALMTPREFDQPKVLFLLNEFATMGHLSVLTQVWGAVRGYGIQLMPILQSYSQLTSLYGDKNAETFVEQAGVLASFGAVGMPTAEFLSKRCGEVTKIMKTYSHNRTVTKDGVTVNSGVNTSVIKAPRLTPFDMFDMRDGNMLQFVAGRAKYVTSYVPSYWDIDECAALARDNPFPPTQSGLGRRAVGFKELAGRVAALGRPVRSTARKSAPMPAAEIDPASRINPFDDFTEKPNRRIADKPLSSIDEWTTSGKPPSMGMKVIVVWNPKGGCGKSTATVHLAMAAELRGDGPVLICDVDEQGTTADWHNFRQKAGLKGPGYAPLTFKDLEAQVARLSAAGAAYLFIDMKAGVSPHDARILQLADRVLIPLNPKPADMLAMKKKMPVLREARKPFTFLLSRCRHNLRTNSNTSAALGVLGHVLPTLMYEREIFSDTFAHGLTAFEIEPNGAAAREAGDLWKELKQQLDSETRKDE